MFSALVSCLLIFLLIWPNSIVHYKNRTLLYWRKPSLLPESVKWDRRPTVEAVTKMACALAVVDLFRGAVARRRCAATATALRGPLRLRQWLISDPPYIRRSTFYSEIRAITSQGGWGRIRAVDVPPTETRTYSFEPAAAAAAAGGSCRLRLHEDVVSQKGYKVCAPTT